MKGNLKSYEAEKEIKYLISKAQRDIDIYDKIPDCLKDEASEIILCCMVEGWNCQVERLIEYTNRQKQLPGF